MCYNLYRLMCGDFLDENKIVLKSLEGKILVEENV